MANIVVATLLLWMIVAPDEVGKHLAKIYLAYQQELATTHPTQE